MKKLFFTLALVLGMATLASANTYKLNNASVEAKFAASQDVTTELTALTSNTENFATVLGGDQSKVGFLVRAFFCGSFSIHRMYMGSGFMWMYCIPVAGSLTAFIDFWYVVIKGEEGLSKYSNSTKFWAFKD